MGKTQVQKSVGPASRLVELHVRDLGVVSDLGLVLGEGMIAITGESGAGKTLIIEAIRLLLGAKADAGMVRPGAVEAFVEGRFEVKETSESEDKETSESEDKETSESEEIFERVLARAVPVDGRSRGYVDGRMAPSSALVELGGELVDLHAQHGHQALLSQSVQRDLLDSFGKIDTSAIHELRHRINAIDSSLRDLGGDPMERARRLDLLRFQLEELDAADLDDPDEDEKLRAQEELLARAGSHREAAGASHEILTSEGGVLDGISLALKTVAGSAPLEEIESRLRALSAEVGDVAYEASAMMERLVDDPEQLANVQNRRLELNSLRRKYGATLSEVIEYRDATRIELDQLSGHDERIAQLQDEKQLVVDELIRAETKVGKARRSAVKQLTSEVTERLRQLALPKATFSVELGESNDCEPVTFMLSVNPGMPVAPLAKAASGGELARSMLAIRLALLETDLRTPGVLIFDEVDAGIGGEAAAVVGKALSALACGDSISQVFVITHLAQVAAFADHQISVDKVQEKSTTTTRARILDAAEREIELARMLSGSPDSVSARSHARELLARARNSK